MRAFAVGHQDVDHHLYEEEEEVIEKYPILDREERPFEKRTMSTGNVFSSSHLGS